MLSCAVAANQHGRGEERKISIVKASAVMLLFVDRATYRLNSSYLRQSLTLPSVSKDA